jgi:AcrR family transcriptional regulator
MIEESIMARIATITNDQILKAAQAEFLAHGIRATSAAIARRAGVSSGILFQRFGTKEALFAAAMNTGNNAGEQSRQFDPRQRAGKGSVQKTLIEIGEILLDRFFFTVPNQMMAWANPRPGRGESMAEQYRERGVRGQKVLVEYLRAEAALKRIRLVDPFVVAQTFGGALWFFAFEQVTGAKLRDTSKSPSRSEFVRQLVDTLWKGLRP